MWRYDITNVYCLRTWLAPFYGHWNSQELKWIDNLLLRRRSCPILEPASQKISHGSYCVNKYTAGLQSLQTEQSPLCNWPAQEARFQITWLKKKQFVKKNITGLGSIMESLLTTTRSSFNNTSYRIFIILWNPINKLETMSFTCSMATQKLKIRCRGIGHKWLLDQGLFAGILMRLACGTSTNMQHKKKSERNIDVWIADK